MFLIKEKSYNSEEPVYEKIKTDSNLMFIPEARVARDYFNTGFYERSYIDWVCSNFCQPDKNIIDIGAHIGWYTVGFAAKSKHVYSFECSPKSFNYLCANIALNGLDYNVTKYNCALSRDEGVAKYYIRDPKDGGGNGISKFEYDVIHAVDSIDVPKKTLDSFGLTNVNFIKIDVEGHEKEVLEGSIQTLITNNYPKILFESWDEHHELNGYPAVKLKAELFQFIQSLGYTILRLGQDMFMAERIMNP
jgi:FkbM family methyltransferase